MKKAGARQKGDALENAVRAIEDSILREAPGYAEGTFKITGKRIVTVGGVRHEIDVFVTASLPAGYEAIFIFECKNWDEKVGKNEIIIFSEKIAAVGAQRGFFVASSFTRDAKAQAAKDSRMQLLTASHFEPVTRVIFPPLHMLNVGAVQADVVVRCFGADGKAGFKELKFEGKSILIRGKVHSAEEYVRQLVTSAQERRLNSLASASMSEGEHCVEFKEEVEFELGEAEFEGSAVKTISISGSVQCNIAIASVMSVYEVEGRGRHLIVGASAQGLELRMELVELASVSTNDACT